MAEDVREIQPEEVIDAIQKFNQGFRFVRKQVEEMDDDQLVELYRQAQGIANVSWLIRCLVIGTAKSRAVRGDGAIKSIAGAFGIGVRAAELDVLVYETFIRDNPDFEPQLPATFYQLAATTADPEETLALAVEKRAENPRLPASAFKRIVDGKDERQAAPKGLFLLIPVDAGTIQDLQEEVQLDEGGFMELYGRTKLYSVDGKIYAELNH
jgi:hypothetical protein